MESSDSDISSFTSGNKRKRIQKNTQEVIEIISADKNEEMGEVETEGESENESEDKSEDESENEDNDKKLRNKKNKKNNDSE